MKKKHKRKDKKVKKNKELLRELAMAEKYGNKTATSVQSKETKTATSIQSKETETASVQSKAMKGVDSNVDIVDFGRSELEEIMNREGDQKTVEKEKVAKEKVVKEKVVKEKVVKEKVVKEKVVEPEKKENTRLSLSVKILAKEIAECDDPERARVLKDALEKLEMILPAQEPLEKLKEPTTETSTPVSGDAVSKNTDECTMEIMKDICDTETGVSTLKVPISEPQVPISEPLSITLPSPSQLSTTPSCLSTPPTPPGNNSLEKYLSFKISCYNSLRNIYTSWLQP